MINIYSRPEQNASSPIASYPKGCRRWWSGIFWEGRQAISWAWLLPLPIVAISFYISKLDYNSALVAQQIAKEEGSTDLKPAILDFTTHFRGDLEHFLPLISIILVVGLIAQDWSRGTLAQLVTRKPLSWFLFARLGYVLLYLLLLELAGGLASWGLTPKPPIDIDMWQWIWQTLLIVLAPTLLTSATGLLIAHISLSRIAGYITPAVLWLANWFFTASVAQRQDKQNILSFFLFGWSDRDLTYVPANWLIGKWILCGLAILLLGCQLPLLRQESRFMRNQED